MLLEEANPTLDTAKDLQPGQKVKVRSAIGNRTIILCITKALGDGQYIGDQVAPDPLDHRPFNNESRMKNQNFKWNNVLKIITN